MKVQTANYKNVISDLKSLLRTARMMKKLHLDTMDLPTIFRIYLDVIDEEFDFKIEHEKIDYFGKLFEQTPEICEKCAPRRAYEESFSHATRSGAKLLTIFNRAVKTENVRVVRNKFP